MDYRLDWASGYCPPVKSGPSSSSCRRRVSRGDRDSLPPKNNKEVSAAEARGEEDEEEKEEEDLNNP